MLPRDFGAEAEAMCPSGENTDVVKGGQGGTAGPGERLSCQGRTSVDRRQLHRTGKGDRTATDDSDQHAQQNGNKRRLQW